MPKRRNVNRTKPSKMESKTSWKKKHGEKKPAQCSHNTFSSYKQTRFRAFWGQHFADIIWFTVFERYLQRKSETSIHHNRIERLTTTESQAKRWTFFLQNVRKTDCGFSRHFSFVIPFFGERITLGCHGYSSNVFLTTRSFCHRWM